MTVARVSSSSRSDFCRILPSRFLPLCVYINVGAYRCTRRVQFYEGERVGVPTGVATFNKGRGHVYVCICQGRQLARRLAPTTTSPSGRVQSPLDVLHRRPRLLKHTLTRKRCFFKQRANVIRNRVTWRLVDAYIDAL